MYTVQGRNCKKSKVAGQTLDGIAEEYGKMTGSPPGLALGHGREGVGTGKCRNRWHLEM